jgi:hypothetical protein
VSNLAGPHHPGWLLPSIIDMASQFIVGLWIESIPASRRSSIAVALLEAMSENRDAQVIAILLKRLIPRYLKLLPFYQQEILELLDSWLLHRSTQ